MTQYVIVAVSDHVTERLVSNGPLQDDLYWHPEHRPFDLQAPDTWPAEVWQAFERAQSERTQRLIEENDGRRHAGNVHAVSSVRYQDAISALDGKPVVCKNSTAELDRLSPLQRPGDPLVESLSETIDGLIIEIAEAQLALSGAERIAEHTGHNEYVIADEIADYLNRAHAQGAAFVTSADRAVIAKYVTGYVQ